MTQTPQFAFEEGTHGDPVDSVQLKNLGPIDLDIVTMELNNIDRPGAAEGLQSLSGSDEWKRAVNLGPMRLGERRLVRFLRSEAPDRESTLRVRLTCHHGAEEWTVATEADIVPPPTLF